MNFLTKNKKKIIYLALIQIIFFTLVGIFSGPFRDGIELQLIYLGDEVIGASTTSTGGIPDLIFSSVHFTKIVILGFFLSLIIYFVYSLTEGIIWYFCKNDDKKDLWKYIRKFYTVNLLWFPFFLAYVFINFVFSYVDIVAKRYESGGFYFFGNLTYVLLLIIYYFASISYVLIFEKSSRASIAKSIKFGFTKLGKLYKIFVLMIFFVIINIVIGLINFLSSWLFILIGMLIIPITMILFRILIIEIVNDGTK